MTPPIGSARAGLVSQVGDAIPDSGLVHRHKASELSLSDGDTVNNFKDIVGSADLNNTSGTPRYNASSNLNGKPAVTYNQTDNEDHYTDANAVDSSPPYHIFYVVDSQSSGTQTIMANDQSGQQHRFESGTVSNNNSAWFHGSWVSGGTTFTQTQSMFGFLHTTSETTIRRNGTQIATASNTQASKRDGTQWRLGSRGSGYFDGDVAEVIWYNEEKTGNELDDIESYLANEYGFSI